MKVVGVRSGDLQSFSLVDSKCNQIKGLAKLNGQLAVGPRAVRYHEIQQTPFLTCRLHFKQFRRPVGQFENGDAFLQVGSGWRSRAVRGSGGSRPVPAATWPTSGRRTRQ